MLEIFLPPRIPSPAPDTVSLPERKQKTRARRPCQTRKNEAIMENQPCLHTRGTSDVLVFGRCRPFIQVHIWHRIAVAAQKPVRTYVIDIQ